MAISGEEMLVKVADSLPKKTGKSLEQWVAAAKKAGFDLLDQRAVRDWLRTEHDFTKPMQEAVAVAAAKSAGWREATADEKLADQYSGRKAALKPVYDQLTAIAKKLGKDVEVDVRAAFVGLARSRQFAAIQPTTATRIDLGLRFKSAPSSTRLQEGKAPGQTTHKVALTKPDDVDAEVAELLRQAYDQN